MNESDKPKPPERKSGAISLTDMLPMWKCHKQVRAARILGIQYAHDGGAMLTLEVPDTSCYATTVNQDWIFKHRPKLGGFYVVYEDGYTSYSPAFAFEDGYSRVYA